MDEGREGKRRAHGLGGAIYNIDGTPPKLVETRVLTRVPDALRKPVRSQWADANKGGSAIDSFLEGPCFDPAENLYVVDIPHGRIFRITPALEWSLVAEYDGWPNGMKFRDGRLWIADYRNGLLKMDPATGAHETLLGHRNSESFKGLNDLTFDGEGNCYFTDQGQTGLHDPTGRVFRLRPSGQLDLVLSNVPSPNGIVVDDHRKALYVAVTRANQVWRGPIQQDGSVSKVGAFQSFYGPSGPDGLALDGGGRLILAHASLGGVVVMAPTGEITHVLKSCAGRTVTNIALRPGGSTLVITESETGTIMQAELPAAA